jgi:Cd2+/Zn2+-exporting ATPase
MEKKYINDIIRLVVSAIFLVSAIIVPTRNVAVEIALFLMAYIIAGYPVLFGAFKNIIKGYVFDENFLMLIASLGAFLIGEYPEAVAVMLFYQVGEFFQEYSVDKSKKSIASLMDIRPDYANVKRDGEEIAKVHPKEVYPGDTIIVKPGEKIPLDGIVINRQY